MTQIHPIIQRFLGLIILSLVSACAFKPNTEDLTILKHYERKSAYGAVVFTAKESTNQEITQKQNDLLDLLYEFAREEQIPVVDYAEKAQADVEINISIGYLELTATLIENLQPIQTLVIPYDLENTEKLIINEMLLLWYPPNTANDQRIPVPGYVLQPTSYDVYGKSFFEAMDFDENAILTAGHQAWFVLPSTKPLFEWEALPRKADGITSEEITDLEYEFLLLNFGTELVSFSEKSLVDATDTLIHAKGLKDARYQMQQALPYCKGFMWTVRAKFKLNGFPRVTDWSGAYTLYKSMQLPPWRNRRSMENGFYANFSQQSYYFTVKSPIHPFAKKCVYK